MSIKESKDEQENDSGRSSPYFSTNLKGFKSAKMTDTMIASDQKEKFSSKILSNRLLISEDKVEMNIKDESFIIDPIAIIDQNHNNININSINSPSDKVQKQYRLQISTQLDKSSKLERIKENIENPLNTSFNNCKRKELFLSGIPESDKMNKLLSPKLKCPVKDAYKFDEIECKESNMPIKSYKINDKMRKYNQRREKDQGLPPFGRKGSRNNAALKAFFNYTFQPEDSQIQFVSRASSGTCKHRTIIAQSLESIDSNRGSKENERLSERNSNQSKQLA